MDFEQAYQRELDLAGDCQQEFASLEQGQRAYDNLCREYNNLLKRLEIIYQGESGASGDIWLDTAPLPQWVSDSAHPRTGGGFSVAILQRLVNKGFSMSKRHRLSMSLLAIRLLDPEGVVAQHREAIWQELMSEGLIRQEDSYAVGEQEVLFYLPMVNIFQARIVADRLAVKLAEKIQNRLSHERFALAMGIADNRVKQPQQIKDMWFWLYRALARAEEDIRQDPSLNQRIFTAIECRS